MTTPSGSSTTVNTGQSGTTTTTTSAAPEAVDDKETQGSPVDAPDGDDEGDESTLDAKSRAALDKVRREARNLRQRLKDLEPAAAKLKELEDRDKSETQKLTEQLAALQTRIADYEVREVRAAAAAAVGLPAELAQFLTATTAADAKEQAKKLQQYAKANPVDLKQGARTNSAPQLTGDQMIRRMAGRE